MLDSLKLLLLKLKYFFVIAAIILSSVSGENIYAQPSYDNCINALEICPNKSFTINNIGAGKTFCSSCEDDFNFCFTPNNSIWLKFNSNSTGGDATINFSNITFENSLGQDNDLNATIISTSQPCTGNAYSQIGNCALNETGNFSLNVTGINPNETFYIVISGDQNGSGVSSPAEFTSDVYVSGTGVDLPIPTISIYTDSLRVCENQNVSIGVTIEHCPDSTDFNWYINGDLVATSSDFFYQTSELDSGDVVSVSTTCYTKCIEILEDSTSSFVIYPFEVNAGEDASIKNGNSIQLNGSSSFDSNLSSIINYSWNPSYSLTNSTIRNPVALPKETTTYTLSGTNNGCTLFDQVIITVEDSDLVIPERFSPNKDGVNDVFEIVGIEQYPNSFLRIYDRWGQEIFQKIAYSYENAWDGKGTSKNVTPGVYFYVLELRDEENQVIKGSVTIVR